jgi:hypothetical protein
LEAAPKIIVLHSSTNELIAALSTWSILIETSLFYTIIIIILLSNKHPYMFVTRKKTTKTKQKQCKQEFFEDILSWTN